MIELPKRNWLTSQELVKLYGLDISYSNANRTALRIVKDYGLPWYRDGRKWKCSDPSKLGGNAWHMHLLT